MNSKQSCEKCGTKWNADSLLPCPTCLSLMKTPKGVEADYAEHALPPPSQKVLARAEFKMDSRQAAAEGAKLVGPLRCGGVKIESIESFGLGYGFGLITENVRVLSIIRELLSLVESQREALAFAKPYHQGGHRKVGRLIDTSLTHTDEVLKRLGGE